MEEQRIEALNLRNYEPVIGGKKNWKGKKSYKVCGPTMHAQQSHRDCELNVRNISKVSERKKIPKHANKTYSFEKNKFLSVKLLDEMIVLQTEQKWRKREQSEQQ